LVCDISFPDKTNPIPAERLRSDCRLGEALTLDIRKLCDDVLP
jgi:hypothetical protein